MDRKDEVVRALQESQSELASLGVRAIGIFGSVARGENRTDSDCDLLVEFQAGRKSFQNFNRLCDLLEGKIGPNFDLVTKEGLSIHIAPKVLKEVEYVPLAS